MLRKLFSHTLIYGAAPQVSKIASLFVLPIITQYLTPTDYGIYGVVTATIGALSVLASLGLRVVLVNSFYQSPTHYKWLWRQVYGFLSVWIIPYALLSSTLIYVILPKEAMHNAWEIILINVLPLMLFGQTNTIATTFYQINKKPLPIALRTAIFGTLTVVLNLYTIAELKLGYMGWFWSTFIVGMLTNLSYWLPLNLRYKIRPIFNFKWRLIKKSLRIALPTVPHFYSGYLLNTSDKLVMEFSQVTTANIGKYNAAYTFGNYFSYLGDASGYAIGPLLNDCYKRGDDRIARNLLFLQQTAFLFLTFGVALWMRELFYFFIRNTELNQMYYLGVIIVMAYNYRPMYFGANAKLFYSEKTNKLWRVSFIAGASNVLLNATLIPLLGYEVAAYTTFACFMYMGYSGFYMKVFKQHTNIPYYPMFWLGLTVALTVLAYLLVNISWEEKVWVSVLIAIVGGVVLWKLQQIVRQTKKNKAA